MTRHPELPERDRRILGDAGPGLHRPGRADFLAVAGQPRLRCVVGDAAQRHGAARGTGLRAPAAHVSRPRPDRSRVSQLRRSAAGGTARPRGSPPTSRNGSGAPARSRTSCRTRRRKSPARRIRSRSRWCRATEATFEHLDFVPLDGGKMLVVLVSTGGHISHKVIEPHGALLRPTSCSRRPTS